MKPATPKTERPPSTQLRKAVFGGSPRKRLLLLCAVVLACGAFTSLAQAPPALLIDFSTDSQVRLSWTNTPGNIVLEETATITPTSVWRPFPQNPTLLNGRFSVMVDITGVTRFFRLHMIQTGELPPDPASIAPPIPQGVATLLAGATEFLYTGPNPIQTGVAPGTIEARRAAVVRGKVAARDGTALPAVTISVLNHPELGQTLTRADGGFDLAVNGGGQLTLRYEKDGFLAAQRAIVAPWRDYAWLPEVVMIPFDPAVTAVDLNVASIETARGSAVSDADGARRATILFPPGTTAEMVLPDGTSRPLTTLNVRATEYTVGASGPKAMPAPLPPSSGYTYAAELSADEAVAAGATDVRFSQALPVYVENFLGFPVGGAVPTGYYDRQKGQWIASANGRVIKVLGITGGLADLDADGDDADDDAPKLAALGVTVEERARLAQLYAPGQTLWRVPITHFTPWDCNWPYGPATNAIPPPGQKQDNPPVDNPNVECRSVIGCENQSLGESLPVTGTPWRLHYRSERTPGRKDAYTLEIPLSGAAALPASLRNIRVEVSIAGRLYQAAFAPAPDLTYTVTWDGRDGYGRVLQGEQTAFVQVHYDYAPQYYAVRSDFVNSFARAAETGAVVSASRLASTITLSKTWTEGVGPWDARALGLGGWSLRIQHAYDPVSRTLLLGDGRRRSAANIPSVNTTVAGTNVGGFSGDGGPATQARLSTSKAVALGPDGSFYITQSETHSIRRVGPDGIITTVTGTGVAGFSGDGGPATQASLYDPRGLAVGPDGSLYIADSWNVRIRRVGPDGIITTVAGPGVCGFSGDGGPATQASLNNAQGVAVGPDGSLYIADTSNNRIRRIGPDGIITTVAGEGNGGLSGNGGPATQARLYNPSGVAVGPDGSLYIADSTNYRIRRVGPDGIITTVAGTGGEGFSGDGGPATQATLRYPIGVAVGPDGNLYIADGRDNRIRRVGPDGIITTVAGTGVGGFSGDGGPATQATLFYPEGVAVGPDGNLYIADTYNHRILRITAVLSGFTAADIAIASEDGSELYQFDATGRHRRTLNALTAAVRYQFAYDAQGRLTTVTDGDGNVTTVERSGAVPSAIVAPGGQRTALTLDANGYLATVTNPAAETHTMSYSAEGLLQRFIDPLANPHSFTYDALGRLIKDEDPVGGSISLARTEQSNGYTVTTTTALGRSRAYQVERLSTGAIRRTVTQPDGAKTVTVINTDGSEQTTYADGSVAAVQYGPDPRWGMLAPIARSVTLQNAGGLTQTITTTRTATLSDPLNLLSLTKLTDTVTLNGRTFTSVYDGATRTATSTSAAGRQGNAVIDSLGRVVQSQVAGLLANDLTYDTRGRLASVTQGAGVEARMATLSYNTGGYLDTVTDPLGRTLSLTYDAAGRVTHETLPDGRAILYGYDLNGNLAFLTPPGRPAHLFGYTAVGLQREYTPPDVGAGSNSTRYAYDLDKQLTRTARPDGQILDFGYDSGGGCNCGQLSTLTLPTGVSSFAYDATTGKLSGITTPDGDTLSYTYTGALLTRATWAGTVAGNVSRAYDNDFRVTSLSVNGTDAITFQYDADTLLIQAGSLTLSRNPQNGLLTGTTLGNATDTWDYNGFGDVTAYSAKYSGSEIFKTLFSYDQLGRITTKTETVEGTTATFEYSYDLAGRLTEVKKDGTVTATYTYDSNGNRLTAPGLSTAPTYDAQDRLTQYGGTTYSYTANGELKTKTAGALVTSYDYDVLGNLKQVALPGGTVIDYVVDGRNRRSGKKVNGVLVQGFLYQDGLKPIAELDGANTVVSRFVYATHINVPDYMIKGGVTYRIIADHLGSPRLVIDVATGAVAQRMDYDEFGNVIADTNPGFQPFGFAGGLYDPDTKLVRFGARDHDAETGRWAAKDPILFEGGDANLYVYVGNDPVNWIDPSGLSGVCAVRRNARPGDPLFIRSKDTRLLDAAHAGANTLRFFQPGQEVIFRGVDPTDSRFIQVEQGGQAGHVLRQNLSTQDFATEVQPGIPNIGTPMSSQAFASSGGTKG